MESNRQPRPTDGNSSHALPLTRVGAYKSVAYISMRPLKALLERAALCILANRKEALPSNIHTACGRTKWTDRLITILSSRLS